MKRVTTKDEALMAVHNLSDPEKGLEAQRILGVYLDQCAAASFERAFGAPPATDGPPKGEV